MSKPTVFACFGDSAWAEAMAELTDYVCCCAISVICRSAGDIAASKGEVAASVLSCKPDRGVRFLKGC